MSALLAFASVAISVTRYLSRGLAQGSKNKLTINEVHESIKKQRESGGVQMVASAVGLIKVET
jgi:hypothetical protein